MRSVLVVVAGVFMLLSSVAHGLLGWPAMLGGLREAGAPHELVGGLAAGGLVAFIFRELNPHFLLFVATGLVAGVPVLRESAGGS